MNWAHLILCLTIIGFACTGCGESEDLVIRPSALETLALETDIYPHNITGNLLAVASSKALGTLIASTSGLYQVGTNGVSTISEDSILGLAPYGEAFIFASENTISIWDGNIIDAGLNLFFEGHTFTALEIFDDTIWIATNQGTYLHQAQGLLEFPELTNILSITSFSGANIIVLEDKSGFVYMLEKDGDDYFGQSIQDELVSSALVGMQNTIFGRAAGTLLQRVPLTTQNTVSWRPVALTTEPDDPGEQGVMQMATDPQTGATWVRTQTSLKRLQQDRVYNQPLPSEHATLVGITEDASVWLADETSLYKLQGSDDPVTFAGDILGFQETNCSECHAPGGPAHTIDTYEQWVSEIDNIIQVIEDGTMPAGGRELQGGTVQLLYKWLEDGLRP